MIVHLLQHGDTQGDEKGCCTGLNVIVVVAKVVVNDGSVTKNWSYFDIALDTHEVARAASKLLKLDIQASNNPLVNIAYDPVLVVVVKSLEELKKATGEVSLAMTGDWKTTSANTKSK